MVAQEVAGVGEMEEAGAVVVMVGGAGVAGAVSEEVGVGVRGVADGVVCKCMVGVYHNQLLVCVGVQHCVEEKARREERGVTGTGQRERVGGSEGRKAVTWEVLHLHRG